MTPFLQNIAKTFYEKHETEISDFTFVFPNRRSGLFFQKYIGEIIDKPVFSPQILTINELFMSQTQYLTADKLGLLFRIYNVYKKLAKSDETFDTFAYWGEMLLGDFDDVDKYLVNAKQLFTNIKEIKDIENIFDYLTKEQIAAIRSFWTNFEPTGNGKKQQDFISTWEILYPIYEQFRTELKENNLAYEGMIFREIAEKMKASEDLFTTFNKIIFVGFNALTPCEKELFKYLKKRNKADFYWDYFSEKTQEENNLASLFFKENTIAFPSKYDICDCRNGINPVSTKTTEKNINLIGIPSSVGQTKETYQILKNFNLNEESSFRTAVVLPEEKFLLPLLYSLPKEIEYVNITMGYPLSFTPLAGLIDYIIELQKNVRKTENGDLFYYKDVLSILNHQYIFGSNETEIKKLITEINSKNRFYISESELGKTELLKAIFKIEQQPQEIIAYLLRFLKQMQHLFLNEEDKRQNALEREFLYHYFTAIQRMEGLLKEWKIEMNTETFFRLFRKLISGVSIPFTGEPLKGLQIMGVLETRALDFDNLIITSMNEGIFPKKQTAPSFVPYNLRKGFGMPTTEHQDSIFAYHFYRLIHRAKNIFFLYDTRTEGLQTGEVSRFIHQLKYHYKLPIAEKLMTYDISIDKQEKIQVEKSEEVLNKMSAFLSQDESKKRALSASAINTYLDCPLKFYFSTVERLSETEEVKENIEANDFGTIFHAVMENIYDDLSEKNNKLITKELLDEILKNNIYIEKQITKAFAEEYLHRPIEKVKLEGQYKIIASILKKYAKKLLEIDKQHAAFSYIKSEFNCKTTLAVFNGKENINLHGFIDRIDEKDGYTRIIDYKTGAGKSGYKDKKIFTGIADLFNKDDINRPKEILQIFMYSLIYQQETNIQNISPAIIFLRNLFDENVNFSILQKTANGTNPVNDFSRFKDEFKAFFTECLEEIFDKDIPFTQTDNNKTCEYCAFKEICGK
jgi:CRISPR/Cas system-associated exonuclease Cas4 (RecB family)